MPLKIAYRKRKMAASKGKSQIGAGKKNMPALVKKIGKMAYAVRNILALRNCAWWSVHFLIPSTERVEIQFLNGSNSMK